MHQILKVTRCGKDQNRASGPYRERILGAVLRIRKSFGAERTRM